jgi:WD40 repeat protein
MILRPYPELKGVRVELQLLPVEPGTAGHGGEVFSCTYSPDGACVLSAGWDGYLRLWEARSGTHVGELSVGSKPLSACALAPDGKHWLAGSLDGMISTWDPISQRQVSMFLAHTRPLSSILFTPDRKHLITASWDRTLAVWKLGGERDSRSLSGHRDIVAGCRVTPDGKTVLSWSHDGTLRTWDLARGLPLNTFAGHQDRVTAAAISPDGCWTASGSRDGTLRLWDLQFGQQASAVEVRGEVRVCFFLLDGQSVLVVDEHGRLTWHALPELDERAELITGRAVYCGDLAPSGGQLALGCDDGRLHFIAVQGCDDSPLVVTPIQTRRRTRTVLDRLFGRSRIKMAYSCTCPACGRSFELKSTGPGQPAPCPHCQRNLRLSSLMRVASDA